LTKPLSVLTQTAGTKAKKKIGFPQQTISAVIRYNVTPVDGLFPREGCGRQLTVRYLATIGARVVAKLIEVDLATGVEKDTRLTLDSRDFNVVNGYQVRSSRPSDFILFDFTRKAYYVEATLTTGNIIANISAAGIQMIKIDVPNCIL
jgi:hypothetical protein